MALIHPDFISGLLAVILLDLVLAGDNAVVIAMAARNLRKSLQMKAVLWGSLGAIAVRVALTAVVVYLLKLPGLMLAGGVLLLPIAWKLLHQGSGGVRRVSPTRSFWKALRTIIVADALMGMDNVLAIAGASKGRLGLVVLGLLISVPLVVWSATLIIRWIERFPLIVHAGAAAIALTAARMISNDPLVADWFDAHSWVTCGLDGLLVATILGRAWWTTRRRAAA
jgi:YjbE family integral membrane protein